MNSMINNNAFEINPKYNNKRKRSCQSDNIYMNPALDLLSTEDPICNTTMEILPAKRTRRSKSCDDRTAFENPALDIGFNKRDIQNILRKELHNVSEKISSITGLDVLTQNYNYDADNISMEIKSLQNLTLNQKYSTPLIQNCPVQRRLSFDLSFIEKIDININENEALCLDDDLNESNIMEIKTITNIKYNEKPKIKNTNPFLNDSMDIEYKPYKNKEETLQSNLSKNFPFDFPIQEDNNKNTVQSSYEDASVIIDSESETNDQTPNLVIPRRLFINEFCDTSNISNKLLNNKKTIQNDPIKEKKSILINNHKLNKQSKILGIDVTNINENAFTNKTELELCKYHDKSYYMETNENKPHSKSNKISTKNIFHKIKDVFKHEKKEIKHNSDKNVNPYEVIRPNSHDKDVSCFENPALNLNSTETNIQEIDDEEDLTSNFASKNPFQITPMKYKTYDNDKENTVYSQTMDNNSYLNLQNTYQQDHKKRVRFNTILNHEKIITGNSFDLENCTNDPSSIFQKIDTQIDDYHNELENCFNEKKLISQHIK